MKKMFLMVYVLVMLLGIKVSAQDMVQPSVYGKPAKIFAVSDVEGELDGFRRLLIANKIIGSDDGWKFGKGHLVICGDLMDRGGQVFELLRFIKMLEANALKGGGYVHVLLGNHDLMNFSHFYRDVNKKYLDASGKPLADYLELIGRDSELGKWLRSKNAVEKIGSMLFLHAGISPELLAKGWTVEQINEFCRSYYDVQGKPVPDSLKFMFRDNGPFWYRGYFMQPRVTVDKVDETLKHFNVTNIVVGHTILERNIAAYYGGKVIGIDVDVHKGYLAGLLIRGNRFDAADARGRRKRLVYREGNDVIANSDIL